MAARPATTESLDPKATQSDDAASPEHLQQLDEALRQMLGACPVPDRLRNLADQLKDSEPPADSAERDPD